MRMRLALAILLLLPVYAQAATIEATSCSQTHVQAAIDAASVGDTVTVPSGDCAYTTSSAASVTIDVQDLILQGAGIDVTTIDDQTDDGGTEVPIRVTATGVRITGFTFEGMDYPGYAEPAIRVDSAGSGYRIDHNKFYPAVSPMGRGLILYADGLVDNNEFINCRQGMQVEANGTAQWQADDPWGTVNQIFIEDNEFNYTADLDGYVDCYDGASYVFRYNTGSGDSWGAHGPDSSTDRGCRSIISYGNVITNTVASVSKMFGHRGGKSITFNNEFNTSGSGSYDDDMPIKYYRALNATNSIVSFWEPRCGESPYHAYDTDYPEECVDAPGMGKETATGNQARSPCYEWDNTTDSVDVDYAISSSYNPPLDLDEDLYNDVPSTTYASLPGTCDEWDAYWVTDRGGDWCKESQSANCPSSSQDGALYVCGTSNDWVEHFVPYTYPHPNRNLAQAGQRQASGIVGKGMSTQ